MTEQDQQTEIHPVEVESKPSETPITKEMSRISKRKNILTSKKFKGLAAVLLVIAVGLLVIRPFYQMHVTKKVSGGVRVSQIQRLASQEQLKQFNAPNELQLDGGNNHTLIGKLAMPSLEVYLPIIKGSGEKNLLQGATTPIKYQTLGEGTYFLVSEQFIMNKSLLFGLLGDLKKGDLLFLTDGLTLYEYEVVKKSKAKIKEETIFLKDYPEPSLILYTKGPSKVVVEAKLNQTADYETSDSYFKQLMNK